MVLAGIDYTQLGAIGAPFLLSLALGTALVGFNEETAYRGVALVAFRRTVQGGLGVVLDCRCCSACCTAPTSCSGQPLVPTVRQIVIAFLMGTVFYVARRVTGSLLFMMAIHALWDFGSFSFMGGLEATGKTALNPAALATLPLLLVMLVMIAIVIEEDLRDACRVTLASTRAAAVLDRRRPRPRSSVQPPRGGRAEHRLPRVDSACRREAVRRTARSRAGSGSPREAQGSLR